MNEAPTRAGGRTLNVLLLQIRQEARVREEEYQSFRRYGRLSDDELTIFNVFDQPEFDHRILNGYDGLIVGGASEASVLEPEHYPFVPASIALMRHCIDHDLPVFASCFGFQLAVLALRGKIVRDQRDFEMGTVPIHLTPRASDDPLFHDVPDGFAAVSVHRERAVACPPGADMLAYTNACCHAFKVANSRFWATQFHPEVDRATLIERLTIFKQHYTEGDDHLQQVLDQAEETPYSNSLIGKFIERVLVPARA